MPFHRPRISIAPSNRDRQLQWPVFSLTAGPFPPVRPSSPLPVRARPVIANGTLSLPAAHWTASTLIVPSDAVIPRMSGDAMEPGFAGSIPSLDLSAQPALTHVIDEDKEVMVSTMQHMNELRKCEEMRDLEIECDDGGIVYAHRFVLAAGIPYFTGMFSYGMQETKMKRIQIKDISSDSLELIVEFIYTGRLALSADNVQRVLFAASILQVEAVVCVCERFLQPFISRSNCLSFRQLADQFNCERLLESSEQFLADHFTELRSSSDFVSMPFHHLRSLLSRSDLLIESEAEVYETVLSWVCAVCEEGEERLSRLPHLLRLVRLTQMDVNYVLNTVRQNALVKESRECQDIISDAVVEMLTEMRSSRQPGPHGDDACSSAQYAAPPGDASFRCRPRKAVAGVVFCVGGRGMKGDPFCSVEAYDWRTDQWFKVAELTTRRRHVGVVSALGKLYAIGGHDGTSHLSSAECFDPVQRVWYKVCSMATPRRGIAVGALEGAIYAVGGLDDSACFQTVERYDIESDTWSSVAGMIIQRGGVGVASLGNYLFAVGGNDGTSSLGSCERYDPLLDKWKMISPMSNRRAGAGVCVLDGYLYAIGGFDDNAPLSTCERYDPVSDTWQQLAHMSRPRGGVGVASMGGRVYAIGGHDGTSYLNSVEAFDPCCNSWSEVADISECRAGAGVAWADVRVTALQKDTAAWRSC